MISNNKIDICKPKEQLRLYGYDNYFYSFKNIYKKNKLPNAILLSGQKGLGKSTFIYHFINYLLSQNEEHKYSLDNFAINPDNSSFKLINNSIHPNFFLLDKISSSENISINQTRNLLKFLNKTTYFKTLKVVLLDDMEYLNLNSSNALLKALEEPLNNTFFFIIDSDTSKIVDTIKSRCIPYKFHFTLSDKKNIFNKIILDYELDLQNINLNKFLYANTPGNCLKYLITLKNSNLNISKDHLLCILFLIDQYKMKKDTELLYIIALAIENHYNELSLNNSKNINNYFINKNKILYLIRDSNKFHLDSKNLLFAIDRILRNEE